MDSNQSNPNHYRKESLVDSQSSDLGYDKHHLALDVILVLHLDVFLRRFPGPHFRYGYEINSEEV